MADKLRNSDAVFHLIFKVLIFNGTMDKLQDFLVKAKQNTYANEKTKEIKIKGGGKLLSFSEGGFHYQDKYFGTNPFSGEEIVLEDGKVIWVMNYYGKILVKLEPGKVYKFLKKALMKINKNKPFRGPKKFSEGEFSYINNVDGDLTLFKGVEKIFLRKKKIYFCYYHGGSIK